MDYSQVTATFPANNSPYTQVVSAQANAGTFTLVNPSSNTVTAFLSSNQSGNPAVNEDVPLPPGASVVLDGTQDTFVYTAAPGTSAQLYKLPSGTSYQSGTMTINGNVIATVTGNVDVVNTPDVNIANTPTVDVGTVSGSVDINSVAGSVNVNGAVNSTGVGGYILPGQAQNLYNSSAVTVTPGQILNVSGTLNVANYSTVVLSAIGIDNTSVAAGAAVCVIFRITWSDSIGDEVSTDTMSMLLNANPGPLFLGPTWEIPVRGTSCVLTVQNIGSVGNITVPAGFLILDGAYRTIPNIRVTQGFIGTPLPTLTGCSTLLQPNPVFQIASWIAGFIYSYSAAVANMVIPLPQWAGNVQGSYQITTAALVRNMTIVDLTYAVQGSVVSGSSYAFGIIASIPASIDANPVPFSMTLPPTQCAVILDNGAGPGAVTMSLIGVGNLCQPMNIYPFSSHCSGCS